MKFDVSSCSLWARVKLSLPHLLLLLLLFTTCDNYFCWNGVMLNQLTSLEKRTVRSMYSTVCQFCQYFRIGALI